MLQSSQEMEPPGIPGRFTMPSLRDGLDGSIDLVSLSNIQAHGLNARYCIQRRKISVLAGTCVNKVAVGCQTLSDFSADAGARPSHENVPLIDTLLTLGVHWEAG